MAKQTAAGRAPESARGTATIAILSCRWLTPSQRLILQTLAFFTFAGECRGAYGGYAFLAERHHLSVGHVGRIVRELVELGVVERRWGPGRGFGATLRIASLQVLGLAEKPAIEGAEDRRRRRAAARWPLFEGLDAEKEGLENRSKPAKSQGNADRVNGVDGGRPAGEAPGITAGSGIASAAPKSIGDGSTCPPPPAGGAKGAAGLNAERPSGGRGSLLARASGGETLAHRSAARDSGCHTCHTFSASQEPTNMGDELAPTGDRNHLPLDLRDLSAVAAPGEPTSEGVGGSPAVCWESQAARNQSQRSATIPGTPAAPLEAPAAGPSSAMLSSPIAKSGSPPSGPPASAPGGHGDTAAASRNYPENPDSSNHSEFPKGSKSTRGARSPGRSADRDRETRPARCRAPSAGEWAGGRSAEPITAAGGGDDPPAGGSHLPPGRSLGGGFEPSAEHFESFRQAWNRAFPRQQIDDDASPLLIERFRRLVAHPIHGKHLAAHLGQAISMAATSARLSGDRDYYPMTAWAFLDAVRIARILAGDFGCRRPKISSTPAVAPRQTQESSIAFADACRAAASGRFGPAKSILAGAAISIG